MNLSPAMKRMIKAIGDAWSVDGNSKRTMNALIDRGLIERVCTHDRRGNLFTKQGVELYINLREENND